MRSGGRDCFASSWRSFDRVFKLDILFFSFLSFLIASYLLFGFHYILNNSFALIVPFFYFFLFFSFFSETSISVIVIMRALGGPERRPGGARRGARPEIEQQRRQIS